MTAPQSVADVLERAADLIEPEGRWTQGHSARDSNGIGIVSSSDRAVCWCAWGALNKVSKGREMRAFFALQRVTGGQDLDPSQWGEWWNDAPGRTQAEVVAKLREAAAAERAKETAV